jgi:hypothetical protein
MPAALKVKQRLKMAVKGVRYVSPLARHTQKLLHFAEIAEFKELAGIDVGHLTVPAAAHAGRSVEALQIPQRLQGAPFLLHQSKQHH